MKVKLITTRPIFSISLIVCILTILGVWLLGIGQHRTVIENSLLSTSILSVAFLLFITHGLYKGVKLQDNIGQITSKKLFDKLTKFSDFIHIPEFPDLDGDADGIGGIILGIVLWIAFTILLLIIIWLFGTLFWIMVLTFVAILYWIFYRALRVVFKNSTKCKGKLRLSLLYGFGYTALYNFWIYVIIILAQMINN